MIYKNKENVVANDSTNAKNSHDNTIHEHKILLQASIWPKAQI